MNFSLWNFVLPPQLQHEKLCGNLICSNVSPYWLIISRWIAKQRLKTLTAYIIANIPMRLCSQNGGRHCDWDEEHCGKEKSRIMSVEWRTALNRVGGPTEERWGLPFKRWRRIEWWWMKSGGRFHMVASMWRMAFISPQRMTLLLKSDNEQSTMEKDPVCMCCNDISSDGHHFSVIVGRWVCGKWIYTLRQKIFILTL